MIKLIVVIEADPQTGGTHIIMESQIDHTDQVPQLLIANCVAFEISNLIKKIAKVNDNFVNLRNIFGEIGK